MLEFLQTVKRTPSVADIPFLCTRIFPTALSDNMVETTRAACMELGAVELIDIAKLAPQRAGAVMRAAVMTCLEASKGAEH